MSSTLSSLAQIHPASIKRRNNTLRSLQSTPKLLTTTIPRNSLREDLIRRLVRLHFFLFFADHFEYHSCDRLLKQSSTIDVEFYTCPSSPINRRTHIPTTNSAGHGAPWASWSSSLVWCITSLSVSARDSSLFLNQPLAILTWSSHEGLWCYDGKLSRPESLQPSEVIRWSSEFWQLIELVSFVLVSLSVRVAS